MFFSGYLSVVPSATGSLKQALNLSGWLDDEVVAAGELRQGEEIRLRDAYTGKALVKLAAPRQMKALPRHFVMAVTADRVVTFKAFSGGDDTATDGPYTIRIKPGECAVWPRASVRITDLIDGAESKQATLVTGGGDRLTVSRANLNRDPDTDELMQLLGGGAAPTREKTERDARYHDNQEELRSAAELRPADFRELAADSVRGRPDFELSGWAERRGLECRGGKPQGGYVSVTCPWSKDILFNVVRGQWPGGTYGVLCHEVRICDRSEISRGYFHGGEANGMKSSGGLLLDTLNTLNPAPVWFGGGGEPYFKLPYTSAGTRVPHLGTVRGLHVARRAERYTRDSEVWQGRPLDDLGLRDHWIAAVRKNSDEAAVERLLRGPIRELLSVQQGLGFEIRIEYGQVIVSRQDFLRRDGDLDALVDAVESLAPAVREICAAGAGRALSAELPPPEWLELARRHPRRKITLWPMMALADMVVKVADERGLALEDPVAFHQAFPSLNIPGEAFGVMRGRLPGTSLTGRLVCCAERQLYLPEDYRKFLSDPGGQMGADVVVLEVSPDAPATPPEGELEGDVRYVVENGVLTAWRPRRNWQANGESLDRLAADVAALVHRRQAGGLMPAA